jgi:acetyl-CoA acetyltransferase
MHPPVPQAGLTLDDIDVYEINEAFASQATYCVQKLGLDASKVGGMVLSVEQALHNRYSLRQEMSITGVRALRMPKCPPCQREVRVETRC